MAARPIFAFQFNISLEQALGQQVGGRDCLLKISNGNAGFYFRIYFDNPYPRDIANGILQPSGDPSRPSPLFRHTGENLYDVFGAFYLITNVPGQPISNRVEFSMTPEQSVQFVRVVKFLSDFGDTMALEDHRDGSPLVFADEGEDEEDDGDEGNADEDDDNEHAPEGDGMN